MLAPPPGLNAEEFASWVSRHMQMQFEKVDPEDENSVVRCRVCGELGRSAMCYVSIHFLEFNSCAGGGEVETIELPFCRTCEPDHPGSLESCVHVPLGIYEPGSFNG